MAEKYTDPLHLNVTIQVSTISQSTVHLSFCRLVQQSIPPLNPLFFFASTLPFLHHSLHLIFYSFTTSIHLIHHSTYKLSAHFFTHPTVSSNSLTIHLFIKPYKYFSANSSFELPLIHIFIHYSTHHFAFFHTSFHSSINQTIQSFHPSQSPHLSIQLTDPSIQQYYSTKLLTYNLFFFSSFIPPSNSPPIVPPPIS